MDFLVRIPFVELLGMELLRFQPDEASLAITLRPELTNTWGVAHGGVTMTLLDVAMAHAARSPSAPGGEPQMGVATVEMKTTFMRPGEGRLQCDARRMHRTASLAFCEGTVHDDAGRIVGHATGTFKYLKALPAADGRRIRQINGTD